MLQLLFPGLILITCLEPCKLGPFARVQASGQKTVCKGSDNEPAGCAPEEPWHQRNQNNETSSTRTGGQWGRRESASVRTPDPGSCARCQAGRQAPPGTSLRWQQGSRPVLGAEVLADSVSGWSLEQSIMWCPLNYSEVLLSSYWW